MNKKTLLIIGASSSIGCEIIRKLANENTIILAHYNRSIDKIVTLQNELRADIVPIQADLSSEDGVTFLINSITLVCEFPDNIVLLAAPDLVLTRFKDLKWDDFRKQLDMQLFTAYKLMNIFLPKMALAKRGKIVFMLSSYTIGLPPAAMAHYITGKYALLGFMKSLAVEYAAKKIYINAISPSMIETSFLNKIPKQIVELTADRHPMKRNGVPSDVVPVIKFLLSDENSFITGVNIPITGGA